MTILLFGATGRDAREGTRHTVLAPSGMARMGV